MLLDEFISNTMDGDYSGFIKELNIFLDRMPHTRTSVDQMLDAISQWDILELYKKLLDDFEDLLTREEIHQIKIKYNDLFCMPLPGE